MLPNFFLKRAPRYCQWRFKVRDRKHIFFTDEKNFYLNSRVWARGKKARSSQKSQIVFLLSAKSLRSMSWCRLVWVSLAKDGCILSKRKLKLIARIMLATCFQILSTTAIVCCPPVHLPARQRAAHRTGQRSVGFEDRVETTGRTDGRTETIALSVALKRLVKYIILPPLCSFYSQICLFLSSEVGFTPWTLPELKA